MDISGVDVDNLSDKEILYLFSDAVDTNEEEIAVLNTVENTGNNAAANEDSDAIFINGKSVNIDDLTDDEILVLYDEIVDSSDLLAYDSASHRCTITGKSYKLAYKSSYGSYTGVYMYCFTDYGGSTFNMHCQDYKASAKYCRVFAVADGNGSCSFKCTKYRIGHMYCELSYTYAVSFTSNYKGVSSEDRYCPVMCK